jgi:hypothetical protein
MSDLRISLKIGLVFACWLIIAASAFAQDGRWVEYSLDGFGVGTPMSTRGDGCVAYTRSNAQILLVFDITTGEWQEIDLGTPQVFEDLQTEGDVVFAFSDDFLIGYSSTQNAWDTITYVGDSITGGFHYGWGNNLAYFITDSRFYVFDASLGTWQDYDYGLPADYIGIIHWVKDDYVGIVMGRTYPAQPKNVVYSTHTQSFNQRLDGTYAPSPRMDHGFAGMFNINYDNETYQLIGYSAISNLFDVVNYTCGDDEATVSGFGAGALKADQFTVYAMTFRYIVPFESVTAQFYGYDTRRGTWDHVTKFFDWDVDHYYGGWYTGGEFMYDQSLFVDDGSFHFYFYNGPDGTFNDVSSGLVYKSTTSSFGGGGTVFCSFDTLTAWGYDAAGARGSYVDLALDKTSNFERGDDWLTITRWSTTSDTMITYFYNGNTNSWSSVVLPDHHNDDGSELQHTYFYNQYAENEMIFYSSIVDTIITKDFADGISVGYRMRGDLAYARSDNRSVLFDGHTGQSHEFDFEFNTNGLGVNSATFYDTLAGTLHGYSAETGNWTTHNYAGDFYVILDTGSIGLATFNYYDTIWTFNGLRDSWVRLVPEGDHISFYVGMRTAIVTRTDRVYAFDPESGAVVDVNDNNPAALPNRFALSQNYPNPFNPATRIEYNVPTRSRVSIEIFNILGQKIITLVDEAKPAGIHRVNWNGVDDNDRPVATGVYLYRLRAGDFVQTKKMMLLK